MAMHKVHEVIKMRHAAGLSVTCVFRIGHQALDLLRLHLSGIDRQRLDHHLLRLQFLRLDVCRGGIRNLLVAFG